MTRSAPSPRARPCRLSPRTPLLLLVAALLAAARTPAADRPPPLLVEDFDAISDGALPDGWRGAGSPLAVAKGMLRAGGAGTATVVFGDPSWRNVALEATVRLAAPAGGRRAAAGLLLRVPEAGAAAAPSLTGGIELRAERVAGDRLRLRLLVRGGGGRERTLQTADVPLDSGRAGAGLPAPLRLRLEARGEWLLGFAGGVRRLQCRRGGLGPPRGRAGLVAAGGGTSFDDVRVAAVELLDARERHARRTRPLVIAHRGFSWKAPENTIASYRLAIEAGAELAECDVYLSADGVPVLMHDESLERTTGVARKVGELTAAELGRLDAGSWKGAAYAGEPVPTLVETLRVVRGKLRFVIEIKQRSMERQVVGAIRAAGVEPIDVMIFSFDRGVVAEIARIEPLLPTTWLVGRPPSDGPGRKEVMRQALRARVSAIGLARDRVDPALVRIAHECGLSVFVWTVDDAEEMRYLASLGADGIISDRPDVLLSVLDEGS